jgi:putative ABC transport system permease protein
VNLREGVAIAFGSLRANKVRTFLTLLGNIIGVMSVVAVVSIIDGMNFFVREEIADEGANVITIARINELEALSDFDRFLETLRNPDLTMADREFVREQLSSRHAVGARVTERARVAYRARHIDGVSAEGWTAEVGVIRRLELTEGRLFTVAEVEGSAPVCVVGTTLVEKLFRDEPPLGKKLRIGGLHCEVIGILERRGTFAGQDPDLRVLMPIGVFRKLYGPRKSITIPIRVAGVDENAAVAEEVTAAMRIRHRLRPDERDDFAIITSANLIDLWESISRSIFSALIFLVSLSLVVGGIVIMNIMLVSVNERTREIGVRKAVGAKRRDILLQFLVEATTLSVAGGIIGILGGILAAVLVGRLSPLPYALEVWSIAVGFFATAAVGIFFGLYPASRAARLDPVPALRHE